MTKISLSMTKRKYLERTSFVVPAFVGYAWKSFKVKRNVLLGQIDVVEFERESRFREQLAEKDQKQSIFYDRHLFQSGRRTACRSSIAGSIRSTADLVFHWGIIRKTRRLSDMFINARSTSHQNICFLLLQHRSPQRFAFAVKGGVSWRRPVHQCARRFLNTCGTWEHNTILVQ